MKPAAVALLLLAALGTAAGCALQGSEEEAGSDESQIRELERRAVGKAQNYPAAKLTTADEELFAKSKKARRELGWKVLAKALKPVKIADQTLKVGTTEEKKSKTLPLFRTWYGGDEFERMFAKMYGDLGRDRRIARATPTSKEITALFDWNATSLGPNSEQEYFDRAAQVDSQTGLDGLGGNGRVVYSPGYVKHLIQDYAAVAGCEGKLETFNVDTPAIDEEKNFTNCMSSEMPTNAAVAKFSWRRNDQLVTAGLPVVDTSAAALAKRTTGELDKGDWNLKSMPKQPAGADDAYTVTLSDQTGYSLVGFHVMTKELRHWVWVTAWWSPTPDEDFGADRPDEIKALGGPWSHYKMCVVTDFEEKDPDPRGGFEGSLGDALAAVHGQATWCSNAFIEKGEHNSETNCIGCHQHAGDINSLDNVLTKYELTGRTKLRKGFPMDYSWAIATPASPDQKDRFLDVITKRMKVYDRDDAAQ